MSKKSVSRLMKKRPCSGNRLVIASVINFFRCWRPVERFAWYKAKTRESCLKRLKQLFHTLLSLGRSSHRLLLARGVLLLEAQG